MTQSIRGVALALLACVGLLMAQDTAAAPQTASAGKINAAVVTGGHPFDEPEFLQLFQGYRDIVYTHLPQKNGGEVFDHINGWPYDVIVLYNFNRQITPQEQKNFVKLLERGVGLVILHHANPSASNARIRSKRHRWALRTDASSLARISPGRGGR